MIRQQSVALYPILPVSSYEVLDPAHRWFPAAAALRASSYERLIAPLVAQVRAEQGMARQWLCRRVSHVAGTASLVVRHRAPERAKRRQSRAAPGRCALQAPDPRLPEAVRRLLNNRLPDLLTNAQKESRVHNLLTALKRDGKIVRSGQGLSSARWRLG